jgi:hypothetical protein
VLKGRLRLKAGGPGLERAPRRVVGTHQLLSRAILDDLGYIVADPLYLIILLVVFLFRCLPGIFVACLGWLLTGRIRDKSPQVILRGLLVALAITPTTAGHAGSIPAVWFGGSYLLQHSLLPLLLVWSLAIPLIYASALSSGKRQRRLPWD